jgi:RNA-directed DNA polymerase
VRGLTSTATNTEAFLLALRGIARKVEQEPAHRFRNLSCCLNEPHLRHAFSKMNKKAASGIDNMTYSDYQKHVDENVEDLIGRLKRQSYKARLVKLEVNKPPMLIICEAT